MGWIILILGLALWWLPHLFKRIAPAQRARMGDAGKGAVAVAIVGGIVLMVIGYRMTPFVHVWAPPVFMVHINNLLVLIAIYLMSPAPKRGRLLSGMRHPMLGGFKLWAFAHLLVNGDLASIMLFGGLLTWAVVEVITINRAEPDWTPRTPGSYGKDAMFFAGSVVLLAVIGWIHGWLGPWPFPT
ncbi:NnrU family protein [Lutimaribacter marinistellae]|uniref:NnrU family protein n=1 Tax=Lutimaribacter marinistellae TaxID=1820329 RepID=A0ABV7TGV4_9RHOB